MDRDDLQTAVLGGGCFWCIEAVFQEVEGVEEVVSGYSGGSVRSPSYREVCSGLTGHAEVVRIRFDSARVSYRELLQIFFSVHDPTTLNRQGADVGTQYRSVIVFQDEEQKEIAAEVMQELESSGKLSRPIVTELAPAATFYPAEDYHQNYFRDNAQAPYCQYVVAPKLEKFRSLYADKRRAAGD
jgi:peptide-methionine (S)-S-oxide reductase